MRESARLVVSDVDGQLVDQVEQLLPTIWQPTSIASNDRAAQILIGLRMIERHVVTPK